MVSPQVFALQAQIQQVIALVWGMLKLMFTTARARAGAGRSLSVLSCSRSVLLRERLLAQRHSRLGVRQVVLSELALAHLIGRI